MVTRFMHRLGLARIKCLTIGREFLVPVSDLVQAETIACPIVSVICPPCDRRFNVEAIERRDPALAALLTIHREQANLRHNRMQWRRRREAAE